MRRIDARLAEEDGIANIAWVVGRSAPAFYYNVVGNRDEAPAFAQALVRTASPADTERLLPSSTANCRSPSRRRASSSAA